MYRIMIYAQFLRIFPFRLAVEEDGFNQGLFALAELL